MLKTNAPQISIIVPVHGVEGFLRETLESILAQELSSYEVIIINDCSPDGSQRIIDEFATKHKEFRGIQLTENIGLGRARNLGFKEAKGKYVTCIDSDDAYEPNVLGKAIQLADDEACDFVIMNHARTWWWGKYAKNLMTPRLEKLAPIAETEEDIAELFDNLIVAWNKVFRRSFLEDHGLKNGDGYYEDVSLSYPALARANRVGILPDVAVRYRQREGSILLSADPRHMNLIDQYTHVIDDFNNIEASTVLKRKLLERIVDHYIVLLFKKEERLPPELRATFLQNASQQLRKYSSYDEVIGAAKRSKNKRRHAAILWSGAPSAYSTFITGKKAILGAKKRRDKVKSQSKKAWGKSKLRFYNYAVESCPIDDKKVVFSAFFGTQYACNPKYISEALNKIAPDYKIYWEVKGSPNIEFPEYVHPIKRGTIEYYYHMATSRVFVNNVNFPNFLIKRKGSIHIQTQHGTPIKSMGFDLIGNYPAAHNMSGSGLAHRSRRWDFCLSSNAHSSEVWRRAFPFKYTMLEYGYPRNDILVNAPEEIREKVRAHFGVPPDKKLILFMPTHREYSKTYVPPIEFDGMAEALSDEYVCLLRSHHFHKTSVENGDFIMNASNYGDPQELLLAADVLVTDYSSVMFDYAILDRPIVVFAHDLNAYKLVRGMYLDLEEVAPGDITSNTSELIAAFDESRLYSEQNAERRKMFRARFCEFEKGDAAERVVRRAILPIKTQS